MSIEMDARVWPDGTIAKAWFDQTRRFRYMLERDFSPRLTEALSGVVVFVMLNPSTADALTNDPTLRRCSGFARAWGFKRLLVVNLFALRTPDPSNLLREADRIGAENDAHIGRAIADSARVVAAWGAHACARADSRDEQVMHLIAREMWCLGRTADGSPRHPLYVPSWQTPIPFSTA